MTKRKAKQQASFSIFRYQALGRYTPVRPPLSRLYQSWANAVMGLQQAAQPKPLQGEVDLFDLPIVDSIRGQVSA